MNETSTAGWKAFWDRGGWWKAVTLVVVYWLVYQGLGVLTAAVFGRFIDKSGVLSDPLSVFFGVSLPILLAAGVLLLFGWSVGWLKELFGPQPIRGRGWMWVAVAFVVFPILLRLIGTQWSAYSIGLALSILFLGLCVGLAEELLTRGFVVSILRKGGSGERVVLVVSSLLFALLHSGNVLGGQELLSVGITVVYAFGFGAMMYLSLRITGRLLWVMLLHAATDPTTILVTGGIDGHSATTGGEGGLIAIAGIFNVVYILFALIAVFLIKNRDRASIGA